MVIGKRKLGSRPNNAAEFSRQSVLGVKGEKNYWWGDDADEPENCMPDPADHSLSFKTMHLASAWMSPVLLRKGSRYQLRCHQELGLGIFLVESPRMESMWA